MAVLGLLKEQDMHGYELKKRLADVFGVPSAVSFGSLYPALARLEVAGAVHVVSTPAVSGAQGGPVGPPRERESRRRKVYGITPQGAEMFVELLTGAETGTDDERSFNVRLAFARYLGPEARLGLLERRRAVLGERLVQLAARARARRDDRYMKILVERQRDELARDMTWLEQLIDEERASAVPAPQAAAVPGHTPGRDAVPGEAAPEAGGPGSVVAGQVLPAPGAERRHRLVPLASASQLLRPRTGSGPDDAPGRPDWPPDRAPSP